MIPLSLYIHVPWCIKKCPYCDFNSHQSKNEIPEITYLEKLKQDFLADYELCTDREIKTIFIGGGTPSLMSGEFYKDLISFIKNNSKLAYDAEITIEANPSTFESAKFSKFLHAGINRLSIGCQSFNDSFLTTIGRVHDSSQAIKAYEIARDAGFKNINLDLMYGLPKQTINDALEDLKIAIELQPNHISWYNLTLEPGTAFYFKPPKLPSDNLISDIEEQGRDILANNNYNRYEISAYCQDSKQCKHNLNYWQFGDYIGIGAGAHGKITDLNTNIITRYEKVKMPGSYLSTNTVIANSTNIASHEIVYEFMLNAMRLIDGIKIKTFANTTNIDINIISKEITAAKNKGLLEFDNTTLKPSPLGVRFLNDLIMEFS